MLDAAGAILRVHYKSMKYDVLFSQGSVSTIFRRGMGISSYMCKKFLPVYNSAKIIKIDRDFSKIMMTNVLPSFLLFTVYI